MEKSISRLVKSDKRLFNEHIRAAKEFEARGGFREALREYSCAAHLFCGDHPTLNKKISSLLKRLNANLEYSETPLSVIERDESHACPIALEFAPSAVDASSEYIPAVSSDAAPSSASLRSVGLSGEIVLPGGFRLGAAIASQLFNHQREGIAWLWTLHASQVKNGDGVARVPGGCLADDSE